MLPAPTSTIAVRLVAGTFGLIGVYLSFQILVEILRRQEASMASFQLRPADTRIDFQMLLIAEALLLGGGIMYAAGGMANHETLMYAGRFTTLVFIGLLAALLFRWRRRFA